MKRILTIVLALTALLGAISCERQFEKTQLKPTGDCVAPVLSEIGNVIVDQVNNKVEAVVFNWTSADFGAPVEVNYKTVNIFPAHCVRRIWYNATHEDKDTMCRTAAPATRFNSSFNIFCL